MFDVFTIYPDIHENLVVWRFILSERAALFFFKFYIRFNFIPILTRNFINYAHFLRFDYLLNLLKRTIERKTTCFIENTKFQKYTVVLLN